MSAPLDYVRTTPITILKPISGYEPNLRANIESFLKLKYIPGDQLIFCSNDHFDPGYQLVLLMICNRKLPCELKLNVTFNDERKIKNPKVGNLMRAYRQAKNDLILISDSNVRADANYLDRFVQAFSYRDGVLTAAIVCESLDSFASRVEAMMQYRIYNKWMIALNPWHSIVFGKSMMFDRFKLETLADGFEAAGEYLAEDYAIGQQLSKLGLKTKIVYPPVIQTLGRKSFKEVISRHVRWGRMKKAHNPWIFFLEPLASFWFLGIWTYLCFGWPVSFAITTLYATAEMIWIKRLGGKEDLLAYMISEYTYLLVWVIAMFGSEVEWRGNKFRLLRGGKIA